MTMRRRQGTWLLAVVLIFPSMVSAFGPVRNGFQIDGFQIAQRWEDFSNEDQERALRNYQRFKDLPPEERRNVEKRYEKWKGLPSNDKDRFRQKFQDYQSKGILDD